jgi:choline dehydrogenase-like flavoprotein
VFTAFSELASSGALQSHIVIVGTGPAALAVAYALEERGVSSVLLESGSAGKTEQWNVLTNGFKGADYGVADSYTQLHIRRQLGGGSNVWGGWCTTMREITMSRTDIADYPQWPLTKADLTPFYGRAGAWLKIPDYQASLIDAIPVNGFDNLNVKAFRFSPPVRYGADFSEHIAKSAKISLVQGVTVLSLKGSRGRANALEVSVNGETSTLKCGRAIVLAAGAVGNARLLARSASELGVAGAASENVGKYFFEHPHCYSLAKILFAPELATELTKKQYQSSSFISLMPTRDFLLKNNLTDFNFQLSTVAADKLDSREAAIAKNYKSIYGVEPTFYNATLGMEQTVHSKDFSVLDDDTLKRRNDGHLTLDLTAQKKIVDAAKKWVMANGAHAWVSPATETSIVAVGHLHGTTRMAHEPAKGVVDADCRVFGVDNVFMAGSSVFPTGGFANPTYTIVALAIRLGDHLASQEI